MCNTLYVAPYVEMLPCHLLDVLDVTGGSNQPMAQIEFRELHNSQRNDGIISVWLRAVLDQAMPHRSVFVGNKDHLTMSRHFSQFRIKRGRDTQENGEQVSQLVLPEVYRKQVLQGLHSDLGHPGKDRTAALVRERLYWPGYVAEVHSFIDNCLRCLRGKDFRNNTSPLVSIKSSYPLEIVSTDFLTVDQCKGGIKNVLVITDHFTKFAVAVTTKNQTAKTTAEALLNNFIFPYGIPTKLLSDQGPNFESQVVKELCTLLGIDKIRTTVHHPMGNGISERFNRSLLTMLRTLEPEKKQDWKNIIRLWYMHIMLQNLILLGFHLLILCLDVNLSCLLTLYSSYNGMIQFQQITFKS